MSHGIIRAEGDKPAGKRAVTLEVEGPGGLAWCGDRFTIGWVDNLAALPDLFETAARRLRADMPEIYGPRR